MPNHPATSAARPQPLRRLFARALPLLLAGVFCIPALPLALADPAAEEPAPPAAVAPIVAPSPTAEPAPAIAPAPPACLAPVGDPLPPVRFPAHFPLEAGTSRGLPSLLSAEGFIATESLIALPKPGGPPEKPWTKKTFAGRGPDRATPAALLSGLESAAPPHWQALYRPPIPTAYPSRPQLALNLGGLFTDAALAVAAEDAQQVKNIGKDLVAMARGLAVGENVAARGSSLADLADSRQWERLKDELDAVQAEINHALEEQHDEPLVTLEGIGAWLRAMEAVSGAVAGAHTPQAARLLGQPEVVAVMQARLLRLPAKTRENALVAELILQLPALQHALSAEAIDTPPSEAGAQATHQTAARLMALITGKARE